MTAEYNREKIKSQMEEHWDMDAATFDSHEVNSVTTTRTRNEKDTGWKEIDFRDAEGKLAFYIEVNADDEVWHFDWI